MTRLHRTTRGLPLAALILLSACGGEDMNPIAAAISVVTGGDPAPVAAAPAPAPSPTSTPGPAATPAPVVSTQAVSALPAAMPLAANLKLTVPDTVVAPGDTVAKVHVRLSEPADRQVRFGYLTRNGSVYEGAFFDRREGTLSFEVGQQEKVISVPLRNMNTEGQNLWLDVSWSKNNPSLDGATGKIIVGPARQELATLPDTVTLTPAAMANGRRIAFQSDFKGPVNPTGGNGVWRTRFDWGRWQSNNREAAPYTDATTDKGVNPHPIIDGYRTLRAEKVATSDNGRDFAYSASMLSSFGWYSFQYGYVELRARVKSENGVTPAFWLLPVTGEWPPEIDIFEFMNGGNMISTIHFKNNPKGSVEGVTTDVRTDGNWHTYGLDWTPDWLITIVDGKEVHRRRNIFNQPMYIIVNTAVGLQSAGPPDADANWHNDFALDTVKVWQ